MKKSHRNVNRGPAPVEERGPTGAPGPAANIREIFAVTLQSLVCANVPIARKNTTPTEGRKQWRRGPKRGHFGGHLGNGAYVPNAGEPQHRLATAQVG